MVDFCWNIINLCIVLFKYSTKNTLFRRGEKWVFAGARNRKNIGGSRQDFVFLEVMLVDIIFFFEVMLRCQKERPPAGKLLRLQAGSVPLTVALRTRSQKPIPSVGPENGPRSQADQKAVSSIELLPWPARMIG